jgi:acyl dehydratase
MPEVDLSVIGRKRGPVPFEYTWQDVVLYALGVGAGADDLSFVYEHAEGGLKVLPSFCVVAAMKAFPLTKDEIEWPLFIHGEQTIRLHRPLPTSGKITQVGEVTDIFDKGKGALYHVRITGAAEDGGPLYDADWVIFYLGAGGFGGDPGPFAQKVEMPRDRKPDFSVSDRVAANQAALYRLSGDVNPLHLDPTAAKRAGFDRPILHGLCTYGFATRALVNGLLGGEPDRLREFKARFSDVVYPGDTLTTEGWKDGDRYLVQVRSQRAIVINQAVASLYL